MRAVKVRRSSTLIAFTSDLRVFRARPYITLISFEFQKLHSRIMDLSAADLLLEPERSKAFLLSRNTDSPSNVSMK